MTYQILSSSDRCASATRFIVLICLIGWLLSSADSVHAQVDIVTTKRAGAEQSVKRKGMIVEWRGTSLTLNTNDRLREIDNDEIVDFQTAWNEQYRLGMVELATGKTQIAIHHLQEALQIESRPWALRIIRSQLVDAYQSIEEHPAAIAQFMEILRDDPQTRFVHLAPLAWSNSGNPVDAAAQEWIKSNDSLTQLMGASWLIGGPGEGDALVVLQELANNFDPNIKAFATAQLWRNRTNVNEKQVAVWSELVQAMPRAVRPGPYFLLADFQSRVGQSEHAIVNLMRLPILYPNQKTLSAAALYRTASLLHNNGDEEKAQAILSELVRDYPQTIWAQQATQ